MTDRTRAFKLVERTESEESERKPSAQEEQAPARPLNAADIDWTFRRNIED